MARQRNHYERLLGRTVAHANESAVDRSLQAHAPEERHFTEARRFQQIFRRFTELLRTHEDAFGTMEELDYDTGTGVQDHTTFAGSFNASVEGLQQLRELLEQANDCEVLDGNDMRRREEMFQQYFRAIGTVEGTAVLRLLAEDEPEADGDIVGMHAVEQSMPLSSTAIEVVNIADAQSTRQDAIALKHTMVERAAKAYDVHAQPWVFDIAAKALLQFDKLKNYPRNIDDCMDEIYNEALTSRDIRALVLPLSTMIEYQLVKIARLQPADPEMAGIELSRTRNAMLLLRDYWAKAFPEIAVKYEAMAQALEASVDVIHSHDMYKQDARQKNNVLSRQRATGSGILPTFYD